MDPYLGEIRAFSFPFAPAQWAACDGQLLSIQQNQALYALLGVMYGGNGTTTFALPDLRGSVPIHVGSGYSQGRRDGQEAHLLTTQEIPGHSHPLMGAPTANEGEPAGMYPGKGEVTMYAAAGSAPQVTMSSSAVASSVSPQAHPNMQPYLPVNYCIALAGIWPSRD